MNARRDDDWIHTHDAAEQLLRYAVPGARVRIGRINRERAGTLDAAQATRRYEVVVSRIGREPVSRADLYALPCRAEPLARRARELADHALRI